MACANVDMDIHGADEELPTAMWRDSPVIQRYQASEIIPDATGPLHDLLQKQPAVLGSLQMMSGLFSVVVGIIFAGTQEMTDSLFTMFRVSHLTGTLFIAAGILSNLLFKYPELLLMSFKVNCGCIIVALVAALLTVIDLAYWSSKHSEHWKVEMLELCVLGLEVLLSTVLCFWFSKEKHFKSP